MTPTVILVKPTTLRSEQASGASRRYIYEHLKYYCSKLDILPAVVVELKKNDLWVIRGGVYLRISIDLDKPLIRALVQRPYSEPILRGMAERGEVMLLDWPVIAAESIAGIKPAWHVFFFRQPLSNEERRIFESSASGWFSRVEGSGILGSITFSFNSRAAEFVSLTPIGNERWYGDMLANAKVFHEEVCPIESYQGMRFGVNDIGSDDV